MSIDRCVDCGGSLNTAGTVCQDCGASTIVCWHSATITGGSPAPDPRDARIAKLESALREVADATSLAASWAAARAAWAVWTSVDPRRKSDRNYVLYMTEESRRAERVDAALAEAKKMLEEGEGS